MIRSREKPAHTIHYARDYAEIVNDRTKKRMEADSHISYNVTSSSFGDNTQNNHSFFLSFYCVFQLNYPCS